MGIEIYIIFGVEGYALCMGDYRVAGNKPYYTKKNT